MDKNSVEFKEWTALGERLLKVFHIENRNYSNYKLSYAELKHALEIRRGQSNFVRSLGGTIAVSGTPESDAIKAMKNLAHSSKGRIPSTNGAFTQAIVDRATDFSFVDAVSFTAIETAKDVAKGVQEVGNTLLDTAKILKMVFIPTFFLILFLYFRKKVA